MKNETYDIIMRLMDEVAKKHGIPRDSVTITSNYGEIHISTYNPGAYQEYRLLEILKKDD